jgi:hypothetical protein
MLAGGVGGLDQRGDCACKVSVNAGLRESDKKLPSEKPGELVFGLYGAPAFLRLVQPQLE